MQFIHRVVSFARTAPHADHLQAEGVCVAGDFFADGAHTDQQQGLTAQVFGQRRAAQRVPLVFGLPADVAAEAARQHQQPGDAGLRHRLGIRAGGTGGDDALGVQFSHMQLLADTGAGVVHPLQIAHLEQRIGIGAVELRVKAHVAVKKNAVNAVAIGLRQPRVFVSGQCHEGDGLAGGVANGFEGIAELRDEFFGYECSGHGVFMGLFCKSATRLSCRVL